MKNTFLILGIALLAIGGTSCKKKGCTDSKASNYDETADKDDESCTYAADVVFFYDQNTYLDVLLGNGHDQVEFFIDNQSYGTFIADNAWTSSSDPDCSASTKVFKTSVDMGAQTQKLHDYEVKDADDGTLIWTGSQILVGGDCTVIELE